MIVSLIAISMLMGCFGQTKKEYDEKIVGIWAWFLIDSENGEKMSPMTMEFTEDGQVIYTIDPGTGMQNEFRVNYWTNNGYLYTENSDSGEEEKAKYQIYENKLTVITGKVISEFIKQ